tara:strand:+ start:15873 stop:16124 length:252 start_codon:yes stop_codon:yes gene_type:complete
MSGNSEDKPSRGGHAHDGGCSVLVADDQTSAAALADIDTAAALVERCAYNLAGVESIATVSELIRIAADLQLLSKHVRVGTRH